MLRLAVSTLRGRWPALAGAFVSLAIGAALTISSIQVIEAVAGSAPDGPERYRAAPIVVTGTPAVTNVIGRGEDREVESDPNPERRSLDPTLVSRLEAVPGVDRVVPDRSFPVRAPSRDDDGLVGHPWSTRAVTPYRLVAGRAPATAAEVVVTAGALGSKPGDARTLVTPTGPSRFHVVGIAAPSGAPPPSFERTLFFSDSAAARLAPAIDAIAVWPGASLGAVQSVLRADGTGLVALTGDSRRDAEPDPDRDDIEGAIALLGVMLMTVAFVAVFVVASTFAFAVALRRRELGLLRVVGATPRQVRRLVLREAALVALVAAVVGAVLSLPLAPALGGWIVDRGLAPQAMAVRASLWPMPVGALAMLAVAIIGARSAARRASRLRPADALRDAAVDRGVMGPARAIVGTLAIGSGLVATTVSAGADVETQLPLTFAQASLLILGLAMFAPIFVPRLAGLLVLPARGLAGAGPLLVREHARAAVRRTAALAAPVLVAVGLAASLAAMVHSIDASTRAADRASVDAGATAVTANGSAGLSASDLTALRALPGATTGAVLDADLRIVGSDGLTPFATSGIDQEAIALAVRTPALAGALGALRGDTIALGELSARGLGKGVGDEVPVWLPDGAQRTLRVAAVVANGLGSTEMYVPRAVFEGHTGATAATAVYVKPGPGAGALRRVAHARGLSVAGADIRREAAATDSSHMNQLALLLVLGTSILYIAIALASTAAVATAARTDELAILRLAGATPGQILRLVGAEALVATSVGALLGLAIAGTVSFGLQRSLATLAGPTAVSMPWALLLALSTACAAIAVAASVAAAARRLPLLRRAGGAV